MSFIPVSAGPTSCLEIDRTMDVKGKKTTEEPKHARGKLKIGDDWNAITIIALSQSNPLKAIAELVENCIDAKARTVTITRGREHGRHFLTDPRRRRRCAARRRRAAGFPLRGDAYLRFHQAPAQGRWERGPTGRVRDRVTELLDGGRRAHHDLDRRRPARLPDGHAQRRSGLCGHAEARRCLAMAARKCASLRCSMASAHCRGKKSSGISPRSCATVSGRSGVRITVVDRLARKQYAVEPRQYEGRLLHQLPALRTALGDVYAELYLNEPSDSESRRIVPARHARASRTLRCSTILPIRRGPLRYLQGHVDAPFVNLTPGTRSGLIHDARLCDAVRGAAAA